MRENLKAAAEEESSSDESSSSSSSSASSSSVIGMKKGQKAKAKAKTRKSAASKPKTSQEAVGKGEAATKPEKKNEKEKGQKVEKSEAILEKSKVALANLADVKSWSVWTNSIKAKDIDMRLNKGIDLVSSCEQFPGEPALVEIQGQLNDEINRVNMVCQILNQLANEKDKGIPDLLVNRKDDVTAIVLEWKADGVTSFLNDIGRKLCEIMITSNGSITSFFGFISTIPGEWAGFGMASLMEASGKDKTEDLEIKPCIAQAQQSLVNCFVDRFRTMGASTGAVLKAIPLQLFLPEICQTLVV